MNSSIAFFRFAIQSLFLAGLVGTSHSASVKAEADMVGEATMVIGVAKVMAADGVERVIERGAPIRVGDRIETGVGGHVHLRFIDGGRLSVRPASRLQVENYNRSVDQPGLTAIKFRLDEGVVRSITGAWGEAARDRFRLNTPVAAIGVKGTDFVVKSDASSTLATVYTGAIILAPLSTDCRTSLGPCKNGHEMLLSEDMKGQMLSLSGLKASPQLVAAVDLLAQRGRPSAGGGIVMADASSGGGDNRTDLVAYKAPSIESRAADVVTNQAGPAIQEAQTPVAPTHPEVHQLVWARLAATASDGDTISRSFAQARENGRQVALGNGVYTLYRDQNAMVPAVLTTTDTSANFRLAGSSAQLGWSDRGSALTEAVQVNNGALTVDFAQATYATQLSVSSPRLGIETVTSNGLLTPTGLLRSTGGNAITAGALSLDGTEGAYFFDRTLAVGQLRGITQWGR